MRKVIFKSYVDTKYEALSNDGGLTYHNVKVPGTGTWVSGQMGFFHTFMQESDPDGTAPVAVIEDNTGRVHSVQLHNFQFLDPLNLNV